MAKIHDLAKQGDIDGVEHELMRGTSNMVDYQNEDGSTPLHSAVYGSLQEEMVKFLLQKGANPTIIDGGDCTPLHVVMLRASIMEGEELNVEEKAELKKCQNIATILQTYSKPHVMQ